MCKTDKQNHRYGPNKTKKINTPKNVFPQFQIDGEINSKTIGKTILVKRISEIHFM